MREMSLLRVESLKYPQWHINLSSKSWITLFGTMFVVQIGLLQWKRHYNSSYTLTTLVLIWLLPAAIACLFNWLRFIVIWALLSTVTIFVLQYAVLMTVSTIKPRFVYKWFHIMYQLSAGLCLQGGIFIFLTIYGVNYAFETKRSTWLAIGVTLICYGLYIGVIGRDLTEICVKTIAMRIRHVSPYGCAICGNDLHLFNQEMNPAPNYKLECQHEYHDICLRAWSVMGRQKRCVYCYEKIHLEKVFCQPWERPYLWYGILLDWVRELLVWLPLIYCIVQSIHWLVY